MNINDPESVTYWRKKDARDFGRSLWTLILVLGGLCVLLLSRVLKG